MTISGQNFDIFQGDNKQIIITVYDENNNALDLTGYNAVWCAHNQTPANPIIIKSTTGGGITVPTPANGQVVIVLESTDTQTLPSKTYGHQLEIQDALGNHATVTTGYMRVLRSITHQEF